MTTLVAAASWASVTSKMSWVGSVPVSVRVVPLTVGANALSAAHVLDSATRPDPTVVKLNGRALVPASLVTDPPPSTVRVEKAASGPAITPLPAARVVAPSTRRRPANDQVERRRGRRRLTVRDGRAVRGRVGAKGGGSAIGHRAPNGTLAAAPLNRRPTRCTRPLCRASRRSYRWQRLGPLSRPPSSPPFPPNRRWRPPKSPRPKLTRT